MSKIEDFVFKSFVQAYTEAIFETGPFHCFVSKVFPREDLFEISDLSYSVQCTFSAEGLKSLTKALTGFTTELNLLGIVGKRLSVQKARVVEKRIEVGNFTIVLD